MSHMKRLALDLQDPHAALIELYAQVDALRTERDEARRLVGQLPQQLTLLRKTWVHRALSAHPSDAMLINKHVRELDAAMAVREVVVVPTTPDVAAMQARIAELERVQGGLVGALEAAGEELAAMKASIGYRGQTLKVMQEVQDALAAVQKPESGEYFGIPFDDGLVPADAAQQPEGGE